MSDPATPARPLLLLVEDEAAGTVDEARLLLGSRKYALILSDHMLPGRDQGLDFLVEALERQPAAKRILMTGYLNPDLLGRSVNLAGLSACLLKPVDMS